MRTNLLLLALFLSSSLLLATTTHPFSNIPADGRESVPRRINGYVEVYRTRSWERLHGFVSDIGKGGASQKFLVAALQPSHGKSLPQMPDRQEFKPERTKSNQAKAERAGGMDAFHTVLVLHLANALVLLLCFFSLGIKNPWKWFQQTRMKNMQKEQDDSQKT